MKIIKYLAINLSKETRLIFRKLKNTDEKNQR